MTKTFTFLCLSLLLSFLPLAAQDSGDKLFDPEVLHEVDLVFAESDYWNILDQNFDGGFAPDAEVSYLMGTIIIDGETVDSVGIRFKGFSSANAETKKPFKIDFNEFVKGKRYAGLRKLNLNNGTGDPGLQRDVICNDLLNRSGVAAPRTSYARVSINGEFFAVYQLIEQVDKEFLQNNFANAKGNLFKNISWYNFEYFDGNVDDYRVLELKTNEEGDDYSGLARLVDVLNNTPEAAFPAAIEEIFNVDLYLKTLAVDVATNNWDSNLEFGRNWYMYEDTTTGVFHWIPWDYNFALDSDPFGDGNQGPVAPAGAGYPVDVRSSNRLLINKLLAVPDFYHRYVSHFCDLLERVMVVSRYEQLVAANRALLTTAMLESPNELYPFGDFDQETAPDGMPAYLADRIAVLREQLDTMNACSPVLPAIPLGAIAINEFVAANDSLSGIADPDGGYPDWIELYNNTAADVDLSDAFLSDKADNLLKWRFPAGTTIGANDYLIVWADEDEEQQGIHANFRLSRDGEAIYLSNAVDSTRIDEVVFGPQQTNVSSSRVPNGTGAFVAQHTTHGYSNDTPVATRNVAGNLAVEVYPNPAGDWLQLRFPGAAAGAKTVEVLAVDGRRVLSQRQINTTAAELNLSGLTPGFYFLRVRDGAGRRGTVKFAKR